jgi:hypothetical protein
MVFYVLQNESRRPQPEVLYRVFRGKCKCVVFAINFIDFAIFTLVKRANQYVLTFYKTSQACFFMSCLGILPVLASEKENIIDY